MELLNIHTNINEKLDYFYKIHKIPNIIFHGPSGCGKRTIVYNFINKIYNNNKSNIDFSVMYVNCSHGKGIKFIREDLKFFAKTKINTDDGNIFKSIILLNADKLTTDAQSALRRCIELFSHNTRFFIVAENKYNLMKPILSRFCEIYVPEPCVNNKPINLYKYTLEHTFNNNPQHLINLKNILQKTSLKINITLNYLITLSSKLYEKGFSGLNIATLLEKETFLNDVISLNKRYELLTAFSRVRKEFRNEKILILFLLNSMFLSLNIDLENISFM